MSSRRLVATELVPDESVGGYLGIRRSHPDRLEHAADERAQVGSRHNPAALRGHGA
jgi:hypothetical protein